ncbi:MAG: Fic family protein [Bacteroidales bacterium]|nr:Fic family protein [Bacteroidales bacterium]
MTREKEILQYLQYHPSSARSEIISGMNLTESPATVKRILSSLVEAGAAVVSGQGRATRYSISKQEQVTMELNIDTYFQKETDERKIQATFNFELINNILPNVLIFTQEEKERLCELQSQFTHNLKDITPNEYRKEMERMGIDLSWKSSQIEGNTYSLLETERLLKEKQTASGKTKEEAIMLLNHKDALDFILAKPDYWKELSIWQIEELHSLLIKGLDVGKGIRKRRVGITGTNYNPLDNEYQIKEALEDSCRLINGKENVFEKALLSLVLLSYIQAFSDGNKRTARITSNAILIANKYCPISFRTVDSVDYKKAMLIFYEQNNISAIKKIFIDQFAFAVQTYF